MIFLHISPNPAFASQKYKPGIGAKMNEPFVPFDVVRGTAPIFFSSFSFASQRFDARFDPVVPSYREKKAGIVCGWVAECGGVLFCNPRLNTLCIANFNACTVHPYSSTPPCVH